MRLVLLSLIVLLAAVGYSTAAAESPTRVLSLPAVDKVKQCLNEEYQSLDALYKHLHAHPELSLQEQQTAARLALELRHAGFTVTESVDGHGVVAVLTNGDGPVIMIRADMDALPIAETTGSIISAVRRRRTRSPRPSRAVHHSPRHTHR